MIHTNNVFVYGFTPNEEKIIKDSLPTTVQIAKNLEISQRSVQRYIETLRVAGEWIEYDRTLKG